MDYDIHMHPSYLSLDQALKRFKSGWVQRYPNENEHLHARNRLFKRANSAEVPMVHRTMIDEYIIITWSKVIFEFKEDPNQNG